MLSLEKLLKLLKNNLDLDLEKYDTPEEDYLNTLFLQYALDFEEESVIDILTTVELKLKDYEEFCNIDENEALPEHLKSSLTDFYEYFLLKSYRFLEEEELQPYLLGEDTEDVAGYVADTMLEECGNEVNTFLYYNGDYFDYEGYGMDNMEEFHIREFNGNYYVNYNY